MDGLAFIDSFDPFADGLGLPRGVVQLGLDLAPALGEDDANNGWLARIAAAFRAALTVANETP